MNPKPKKEGREKRLLWASLMLAMFWLGIWAIVLVSETFKLQSGEKIIFTIQRN